VEGRGDQTEQQLIDTGKLVKLFQKIVGRDSVLSSPSVVHAYECDAYTVARAKPSCVVLPSSTEQVRGIVRLCNLYGVPFVARGAGTGLSGGATPVEGAVVISLKRMNRIKQIDLENRMVLAEAGVVNLHITKAVQASGYCFAPDPSSQHVSTIGGNIAENAGGPHTLKHGVTSDHILALKLVTPAGEVVEIGSRVPGGPGLDFLNLIIGSEGTLGIVTEAWLKLTPIPEYIETALAFFNSTEDAVQAVARIIASGVVPLALEFLDHTFMRVVSEAFGLVFPDGARAFLLMEFDGRREDVVQEVAVALEVCSSCKAAAIEKASTDSERKKLWFARKNAVGALGRLAPSKVTHDGVVPPSKLPEMLAFINAISARENMLIANLSHAGDGNLHPGIPFDDRDKAQVERVERVAKEILGECARLGGSITGEHGVGLEKREFMRLLYSDDDLKLQDDLLGVFGRTGLCNPTKMIPVLAEGA